MKIGIDVREISGQRTGKGQFVYNFIKALSKYELKYKYILYLKEDINLNLPDNFKKRIIKSPNFLWHLKIAKEIKNEVNIYLSLTSYIVPALSKNCIVFVHDLVSFLSPAKHQLKAKFIEKLTIKMALKNSKKIICISESTKKDLLKLFKVDRNKISVVHPAVSEVYRIIEDEKKVEKVLSKYKLPNKFLLFVGTLEPRKNLIKLIRAYSILKTTLFEVSGYKNINITTPPLVIVGKKGWYYKEIFREAEKLNLQNNIIFTGYVKDNELPYLYNKALCFVYPSLYEGFGLPVLEAMKCGCPVISSNVSSIPEIVGDSGILINPKNEEEIAEAMKRILLSGKLRNNIAQKELRRAENFRWERTMKKIFEIIKHYS